MSTPPHNRATSNTYLLFDIQNYACRDDCDFDFSMDVVVFYC